MKERVAVPRVPDRMWFGVTVFSRLVEWGICPQTFSFQEPVLGGWAFLTSFVLQMLALRPRGKVGKGTSVPFWWGGGGGK